MSAFSFDSIRKSAEAVLDLRRTTDLKSCVVMSLLGKWTGYIQTTSNKKIEYTADITHTKEQYAGNVVYIATHETAGQAPVALTVQWDCGSNVVMRDAEAMCVGTLDNLRGVMHGVVKVQATDEVYGDFFLGLKVPYIDKDIEEIGLMTPLVSSGPTTSPWSDASCRTDALGRLAIHRVSTQVHETMRGPSSSEAVETVRRKTFNVEREIALTPNPQVMSQDESKLSRFRVHSPRESTSPMVPVTLTSVPENLHRPRVLEIHRPNHRPTKDTHFSLRSHSPRFKSAPSMAEPSSAGIEYKDPRDIAAQCKARKASSSPSRSSGFGTATPRFFSPQRIDYKGNATNNASEKDVSRTSSPRTGSPRVMTEMNYFYSDPRSFGYGVRPRVLPASPRKNVSVSPRYNLSLGSPSATPKVMSPQPPQGRPSNV
eukprot:PhF_6_TR19651/c0_g1_i1/m.28673